MQDVTLPRTKVQGWTMRDMTMQDKTNQRQTQHSQFGRRTASKCDRVLWLKSNQINLSNKRTDRPLTLTRVNTCRNSLKYTGMSNTKHILYTQHNQLNINTMQYGSSIFQGPEIYVRTCDQQRSVTRTNVQTSPSEKCHGLAILTVFPGLSSGWRLDPPFNLPMPSWGKPWLRARSRSSSVALSRTSPPHVPR